MAKISDYADKASAESGIGAQPSKAKRTSGTLTYWKGDSYETLALSTASPGTYTFGEASASYPASGGSTYEIRLSGNVVIGPSTATPAGASPCLTAACSVTSNTGSIVATVLYEIWRSDLGGSVQVAHFTVTLDLGASLAKTSYRAAPNA
jgi:hypothetical protein